MGKRKLRRLIALGQFRSPIRVYKPLIFFLYQNTWKGKFSIECECGKANDVLFLTVGMISCHVAVLVPEICVTRTTASVQRTCLTMAYVYLRCLDYSTFSVFVWNCSKCDCNLRLKKFKTFSSSHLLLKVLKKSITNQYTPSHKPSLFS